MSFFHQLVSKLLEKRAVWLGALFGQSLFFFLLFVD